ncbi:hypothetical protein ACT17Q_13390 [Cellulomonas sp. CW35]|uniref:hypothetical protein n=1 Tax=Cellulomonas sp. CW35 TaxID=3458249 RepID=UPI0040348989
MSEQQVGDLRLALRLVRGGGRTEAVRLTVLAVGVALAVLGVLVGTTVPRVSADAASAAAARTRVVAGPGAPTTSELRVLVSDDRLGRRPWTHAVVTGTHDDAPLPPGLVRWPRPGETIVSPALSRALLEHPDVSVPGVVPEHIGAAGLTGPDELVSWTVLPAGSPPLPAEPVIAFGGPVVTSSTPASVRATEITVLVLGPAALLLALGVRACAGARAARTRALVLAGMGPRRCARVFGWEMAAVVVVGACAGVATARVVHPWLGSWGVLGRRWFPEQGAVPVVLEVLLAVTVALVVLVVARRTMRSQAGGTRQHRLPSPRVALLGYVLGVPAAACLAWLCVRLASHPGDQGAPDSAVVASMVASCAAALAVVVAAPHAVHTVTTWLADRLAARATRPDVRLGLRGAGWHAHATGRCAALAAVLVMTSAYGTGLLVALDRDAHGPSAGIEVDLSTTTAAQRDALAGLGLTVATVERTAADTSDGPWTGLDAGWVTFAVSDETAAAVTSRIHRLLPELTLRAGADDADLVAYADEQTGVVRAGLAVGTGLVSAALIVCLLEVWWSRRRTTAALGAIGTPRRAMRVVAVTQMAAPVLVTTAIGVGVGVLGGWTAVAYAGTADMLDPAVVGAAVLPAVAAVALVAAVAWVAGGRPAPPGSLADL